MGDDDRERFPTGPRSSQSTSSSHSSMQVSNYQSTSTTSDQLPFHSNSSHSSSGIHALGIVQTGSKLIKDQPKTAAHHLDTIMAHLVQFKWYQLDSCPTHLVLDCHSKNNPQPSVTSTHIPDSHTSVHTSNHHPLALDSIPSKPSLEHQVPVEPQHCVTESEYLPIPPQIFGVSGTTPLTKKGGEDLRTHNPTRDTADCTLKDSSGTYKRVRFDLIPTHVSPQPKEHISVQFKTLIDKGKYIELARLGKGMRMTNSQSIFVQ